MNFAVNGICKTSDFASQQELHRLEGVYHQFVRLLDTEDQMFLYLPNDCSQSWDRLIQEEVILVGYILVLDGGNKASTSIAQWLTLVSPFKRLCHCAIEVLYKF